ncbi:peroxiredoxin (alkyl hydroperoxide reductase subunit C) [Caldalkalibacillus uzonensis]|uniref:Peroxiredoxin (Alkyl hydroperoxide reductase subunit C) n=1 Tax=Caldalkalibacillus uzonensis TaxID=353224 RepID=A0ABU0CTG5_9BACI|nr:peroxiredoxin (alkyl hydroperoxide reductase subunit C) [Caldalkalibacillus uzonensis]
MAAVAAVYPQLRALGAEVWGISTDSVYAHKVFKEISPSARQVQFPLLSDRNHLISRAYRVLDEKAGAAFRATVIVDPDGMIVAKLIYPREVGRNTHEIVRLIQGLQFSRQTGLGVPANWVPGMSGIQRQTEDIGRI